MGVFPRKMRAAILTSACFRRNFIQGRRLLGHVLRICVPAEAKNQFHIDGDASTRLGFMQK
jgi:hypothetical protein